MTEPIVIEPETRTTVESIVKFHDNGLGIDRCVSEIGMTSDE
jgi:hypothetical protein